MRGVALMVLTLLGLTGCGDNIVEIGGLSGSTSPGRVSLLNNWSRTIWAEHTDEEGSVARTTIQPGETKVISGDYVFDGGDEVYFVLAFVCVCLFPFLVWLGIVVTLYIHDNELGGCYIIVALSFFIAFMGARHRTTGKLSARTDALAKKNEYSHQNIYARLARRTAGDEDDKNELMKIFEAK